MDGHAPPAKSQKRQKQSRHQPKTSLPEPQPQQQLLRQQIGQPPQTQPLQQPPIFQQIGQMPQQLLQQQHRAASQYLSTPKIMLKLVINKETQKLLFAEAGKDFVDFLFSIPSLPIGAFLSLTLDDVDQHLVGEGSLVNLYKTIKNLDERYMQPQFSQQSNKEALLFPTTADNIRTRLQFSKVTTSNTNVMSNNLVNYLDIMKNNFMGYVRGTTTYMIMDDLNVEPMSVISSVSFLDKFGALDVNKLEEREVIVGDHECMEILKESMVTKNVLTSVFLGESDNGNREE